jgi:hypothetical protein
LFKEEKITLITLKVAVKIGEKSEYVEIISSDQIDSSSKILIKGVLIWLTKIKCGFKQVERLIIY